ncbi:helix-turn-helix domain-containing protein [Pseudoduganella sp. SL102]|uniref:GlxA family transcriptional regulator n=1 Tax=Pseudoduganella sp. SL102 TaxID=2995154 RepID=UPI00248AA2AC|nr:helix-turn-helix domain-containing protein [Pseudoduganella sp. SL102]WBS01900.1 helix-turn-helix domain-containing protein [Pseudoduganella sp. SL102]
MPRSSALPAAPAAFITATAPVAPVAPIAPTGPVAPVNVWLLVFPGFLLLDATGPIQVFASANDEARDAGRPEPYRIHLVARGGGAVASSAGVSVLAAPLPRRGLAGGTLVVSGGGGASLPSSATTQGRALLRWVARAGEDAARCCSVCTGAFVLARAGLLDGRRAVTHWQDVSALREQHPLVDVQDNAIHVRDGKFRTSAGISAGMDLALSLVEEDLGRAAALAVARRMVLFLKRPGGQRQFSAELLAQSVPDGVTAQLTAWLRPRLARQLDIDQMAAACALSVRTLHRRLRQEADATPAQLLARLRMELACSLLERPRMTVKEAARRSGHGSEYNLRRAFMQHLGVLPSEYQARFA